MFSFTVIYPVNKQTLFGFVCMSLCPWWVMLCRWNIICPFASHLRSCHDRPMKPWRRRCQLKWPSHKLWSCRTRKMTMIMMMKKNKKRKVCHAGYSKKNWESSYTAASHFSAYAIVCMSKCRVHYVVFALSLSLTHENGLSDMKSGSRLSRFLSLKIRRRYKTICNAVSKYSKVGGIFGWVNGGRISCLRNSWGKITSYVLKTASCKALFYETFTESFANISPTFEYLLTSSTVFREIFQSDYF